MALLASGIRWLLVASSLKKADHHGTNFLHLSDLSSPFRLGRSPTDDGWMDRRFKSGNGHNTKGVGRTLSTVFGVCMYAPLVPSSI